MLTELAQRIITKTIHAGKNSHDTFIIATQGSATREPLFPYDVSFDPRNDSPSYGMMLCVPLN